MRSEAAFAAGCLTAAAASSNAASETCDGGEGLVELARGLWRELRFLFALRALPARVALFQWRARRLALRLGDRFSLTSATRPRDLAKLIDLARTRKCAVELGTGTAWTAISLALADRDRKVVSYDRSEHSEGWSASPEREQALLDEVLTRWIPVGAVTLEIGPGSGRWSETLAMRALHLVLVDVNERPLELCRALLGDEGRVEYIRSSGNDLPGVTDCSIDAVWSFDAFVYMAPRDQVAYLREIARVLVPGGVAVIHHGDGRDRGEISRELFATLASRSGLRIESQFDSWGPGGCYRLRGDAEAITVCRR